MNQVLRKLLVEDYKLKIAAVVMAAIVWFYFQSITTDELQVDAGLQIKAPDGLVVLVDDQNGPKMLGDSPIRLRLTVRGPRSGLSHLGSLDGLCRLDSLELPLETAGPSRVPIPLQPRFFKLGSGFAIAQPQQVFVTLDRLIVKTLKLEPRVLNPENVAPGYELGPVSFLPQAVEVKGPSSMLKDAEVARTTSIQVPLGLMQEISVHSTEVEVDGMRLPASESIQVTLHVLPKRARKLVENVALRIQLPLQTPLPGLRVLDGQGNEIRRVNVEIEGPPDKVESVRAEDILAYVDVSVLVHLRENWNAELAVSVERLPPGVHWLQTIPATVTVKATSPLAE